MQNIEEKVKEMIKVFFPLNDSIPVAHWLGVSTEWVFSNPKKNNVKQFLEDFGHYDFRHVLSIEHIIRRVSNIKT